MRRRPAEVGVLLVDRHGVPAPLAQVGDDVGLAELRPHAGLRRRLELVDGERRQIGLSEVRAVDDRVGDRVVRVVERELRRRLLHVGRRDVDDAEGVVVVAGEVAVLVEQAEHALVGEQQRRPHRPVVTVLHVVAVGEVQLPVVVDLESALVAEVVLGVGAVEVLDRDLLHGMTPVRWEGGPGWGLVIGFDGIGARLTWCSTVSRAVLMTSERAT